MKIEILKMLMHRNLLNIQPSTLALVIGTILLLAVGQVLFKFAASDISLSHPKTLLSFWLLCALVTYGIATAAWLLVLSRVPLSVAFPFYGLIFLIVPVLAWLVLNEPIKPQVVLGGLLIFVGVIVSSLGNS